MSNANAPQYSAFVNPVPAATVPAAVRVPGSVKTAAVLGILMATITTAASVVVWVLRSDFVETGLVQAIAALNVFISIAYVVGAVLALRAKTAGVLMVVAGTVVAVSLISDVISFSASGSLSLFVALWIFRLLRSDSSETFFAARRYARKMSALYR